MSQRVPSCTKMFVTAAREPERFALSAIDSPLAPVACRMFSSAVTHAVEPATVHCSSVITNWMKFVLRKIDAHDSETSDHPRSIGHPGCVTTTRSECSHTPAIRSTSHASSAA
jgi:hypothetical protein